MKVILGLAIVALHVVGYIWLVGQSGGNDLVVELRDPMGIDGTASSDRVFVVTDTRPGLQRRRWTATYRGGFVREVGATQLVGPFQDPRAPACSGRIIVGQRMLDEMAPVLKDIVERQLRGSDIFPVGAFRELRSLALRWADGYVRADANVTFERANVVLVVRLIPEPSKTELKFRIAAVANLKFTNAVLRWLSDKLNANSIATRVASDQIDDILVTTLAPPPPFELPGGQTLQFAYCDAPLEIIDGAYAALPFSVTIGTHTILPPRFGLHARPTPAATTKLALDLDPDALNALLFELWRTGWLDRKLAEVGLDRRFNSDPTVTDYLSIRITPLRLALPPVISPNHDGSLRLAADARLAIHDGTRTTNGRIFGALEFRFSPAPGPQLPVSVDLGALELACERSPTTLVPCYGDLVAALRGRGDEFHGALTDAFAKLLADVFVERHVSTPTLPAEVVIQSVVPSITSAGTLHLELDGKLAPVM